MWAWDCQKSDAKNSQVQNFKKERKSLKPQMICKRFLGGNPTFLNKQNFGILKISYDKPDVFCSLINQMLERWMA